MNLSPPQEGSAFLSTLSSQHRDRRIALGVTVLALAAFAAAAPFARMQLPRVWAFIPIYETVLVINDLITAVLLFGQYAILGSTALLLLACGYLFTACMASTHAMTFPGLFSPSGLLGAGPQSTAWLYMFWHGGFPLFVLAYALVKPGNTSDAARPWRRRRAVLGIAGTIGLTVLCTALATAGQDWLPPIMAGNRYTPLMLAVVTSAWALSLIALLVLWRRRPYSVLHLWLMVVMVVWLADIALSAVLNAGRFDLGFYAGRLCGMVATSLVLLVLLLENAAIHARLLATSTELSAANKELDTFSYAVSHDLRAPLRAMSGFSVALVEDHGPHLPPEAREYLDEIVRASARMAALVDGLLTLARSTRGGLQRATVDISALSAQVRAELERTEPARQVHWQIEPALTVDGDPRMVEVILRNLLGNAWKFTAQRADAAIRVYAEPARPAPSICVADNGAGFEMAHSALLFQPFQRLHRQDEFPGTGIGLATVHRIVQRHGGDIRASSAPGAGTTFRFSLTGGLPGATS